jgi:hypothetical protein
LRERAEARDVGALSARVTSPAVQHLALDATLATEAQAELVLEGR